MMPVPAYHNRQLALFGLGASGMAAAQALAASGARVDVWDDGEASRETAQANGLHLKNLSEGDMGNYDALIVAPGVPLTHPVPHPLVALANDKETPIIGDIELFAQARNDLFGHRVAAITGTNGKSTTTALLTHIIEACGTPAVACGNIGTPIMALDPLPEGGIYVIEMSSYQIDLTHNLRPEVAILLNVAADHLDRHGTIENYASVKTRLLTSQQDDALAIVGVDDEWGLAAVEQLRALGRSRVIPLSVTRRLDDGISVIDGELVDAAGDVEIRFSLNGLKTLPGQHNWQNAAAAYAAASRLYFAAQHIRAAMATFPGLAHRCELIAEDAGLQFINDSKATNVDAALRALSAFDNIYWIAGGRAKDDALDPVTDYAGQIKHAFLIGEAADDMAQTLPGLGIDCEISGTMEAAFSAAVAAAAGQGGTILLSPACASFDQYRNFEVRGDAFRNLVTRHLERGAA
jgi:UDP-N-acetylmuramoylalanine--D-glutamate ligase